MMGQLREKHPEDTEQRRTIDGGAKPSRRNAGASFLLDEDLAGSRACGTGHKAEQAP
jgi:hypothetical protein